MRVETRALLFLALSVVVATARPLPLPEVETAIQSSKVIDFLNTNQELRKHYGCRFTGEFRAVPDDLQSELDRAFPKYKVLIAEMEVYTDPPAKKRDLVLMTDAETGAVMGFVWFFSWTMPSASFERILLGHKVQSKEEALSQIKSLAKLIVYTGEGQLGKATTRKGKITVEMIKGKQVFRTLEVRIHRDSQLGGLIIRRQDGKKIH